MFFSQGISVICSYKLSCNNSYNSDIGSRGYGMDWGRNISYSDNTYFCSNKYHRIHHSILYKME